jgi:hypothetical protein
VPQPSEISKKYQADWTAKYGAWSVASLNWIPAFYAFLAAVKQADSLDPQTVSDLLSSKGVQWESPNGKAMLVKRPDYKSNRFCDTCASLDFGLYKNGKYEYLATVTAEESLKANETAFGGGQWK